MFTSAQTETYKDVKVNPELTEEQRGEVMKVLEEFHDVLTDVPGLTNLGKHPITYEHVLDLKDRLQSTCELAQIELQKSQIRQKEDENQNL